jgi:hypothetical protein
MMHTGSGSRSGYDLSGLLALGASDSRCKDAHAPWQPPPPPAPTVAAAQQLRGPGSCGGDGGGTAAADGAAGVQEGGSGAAASDEALVAGMTARAVQNVIASAEAAAA